MANPDPASPKKGAMSLKVVASGPCTKLAAMTGPGEAGCESGAAY